MKLRLFKFDGWVDALDVKDLFETIREIPIYRTRKSCLKAWYSYDRIKPKRIRISIRVKDPKPTGRGR